MRESVLRAWRIAVCLTLLPAARLQAANEPEETEHLRALEGRRRAAVLLLDQVQRALPELLWLERLVAEGDTVTLSGRSLTTNAVADLIENLDELPTFGKHTLIDAREVEDPEHLEGQLVRFEVRFDFTIGAESAGEAALAARPPRPLPAATASPEVLQRLRRVMESGELALESFTPGALAAAGPIQEQPVAVAVVETTYHDLALLFDRLSRFPTPIGVAELTIEGREQERGTLAATFTLKVPFRSPR